jgi:hypothetical protein
MNSPQSLASASRGGSTLSYTEVIMTAHNETQIRLVRSPQEGNSLGQSRLSMSEVQICGIPKLSSEGVAPTP